MSPYRTPLQHFLAPSGIVFFGASPESGSFGHGLLHNLRNGAFASRLHVVSRKHAELDGHPCYATLGDIRAPLSLALIATPAQFVPDIVEACVQRGIRAAVVFSSNLRPDTPAGMRLNEIVARSNIRLFGPHALGYILPHANINLTPIILPVPAGNLALVSQSGTVCANILDWNHNEEFGFSAIFVPGESDDIELPEILDHLASDRKTESILLYLEGLRDARGFLSAVRAAASIKPVIAVKAGQGPMSARIAKAHSGARVDRDDAFDAALRRAGVLRVRGIGDMFAAARALTTPRKPRGNRLSVIANGGGPAVMALDQAEDLGMTLARLSPQTQEQLATLVPGSWATDNPVDVLFDTDPERFVSAITACLDDPGVDGALAILTPNTYVDPLAVAEATIAAGEKAQKPVFTCWLGEMHARSARAAFAKARFPTFRTPENAVAAFAYLANWVRDQELLLEAPAALSSYLAPNVELAHGIIKNALSQGRHNLSLPEAKEVLSAFHIPVTPTLLATTPTEAVNIANRLRYPLSMRAVPSPNQPRATVAARQHLRSAPEIALAFREFSASGAAAGGVLIEPQASKPDGRWLAISIRHDLLFGPVISLSESGIASFIYDVRNCALPPLNARLIFAMLQEPHLARLLGPLPGKQPVAIPPIHEILQRTSELASELPWVHRLEISALADSDGIVVVDVSIEIQTLPETRDRYGHMAICPYPLQLESVETLKDGSQCALRPLRPEDTAALQDFVRNLSARSKRLRFFSALSELPRHQLAHYAQIDYGREMVIVATGERDGQPVLLGEARYSIMMDGKSCDFAVVIADEMAGKGLGARLMNRLMDAARERGLSVIRGQVLADNESMIGLMESLDFIVQLTDDENTVDVLRRLD
jgi:acetyltransferase